MNYSEDEYVPELGGYYIKNKIVANESDILLFMRKYNLTLNIHINMFNTIHACDDVININKLMFYINLLNFNNYNSWKIRVIGRYTLYGVPEWKKIFKKVNDNNSQMISLPLLPHFDKFNFSIYRDI
jgi:hypothetical protein